MVNPFYQTPAEKEECVLDMIERGYGYPQILKECHVSPNTISSIKKKYGGTTDNVDLQSGKTSKESQAFRLFQQGKSLVDVKTEVDIDSADVVEYYRRFQELSGVDMYNQGYDKVKGNITPYLQMFDLMNALGLTPEQVQEQVRYGYHLPNLQSIHTKMNSQIQDMAAKHCYLDSQLESTEQQVQQCKNSLRFYDNECAQKINEIKSLCATIDRKKRLIRRLDNSKGYDRIKEAAKKETKRLLQDNRALLALTLSTVLEAVRKYNATRELIFSIVMSSSANICGEPWIESHKSRLVELSEHIQKEMAEQIAKMVVSKIQDGNRKAEA
jgi:uncharacterized protein YerC